MAMEEYSEFVPEPLFSVKKSLADGDTLEFIPQVTMTDASGEVIGKLPVTKMHIVRDGDEVTIEIWEVSEPC